MLAPGVVEEIPTRAAHEGKEGKLLVVDDELRPLQTLQKISSEGFVGDGSEDAEGRVPVAG